MLIPKLLKWRPDQKEFIESLPGNALEHIRRAIDDYIEKKKKSSLNVASISPSKLKKGGINGSQQPKQPSPYIQPTPSQ